MQDLFRLVPGTVDLVDEEGLRWPCAHGISCPCRTVEPTRAAIARSGTRHRSDVGIPTHVESDQARHRLGIPPDAVVLVDDKGLAEVGPHRAAGCVTRTRAVVAPGAAVTWRGTRNRGDRRVVAQIEPIQSRDLRRGAPGTILLIGYEGFRTRQTASSAVARRGAGKRRDSHLLSLRAQPSGAGELFRVTP